MNLFTIAPIISVRHLRFLSAAILLSGLPFSFTTAAPVADGMPTDVKADAPAHHHSKVAADKTGGTSTHSLAPSRSGKDNSAIRAKDATWVASAADHTFWPFGPAAEMACPTSISIAIDPPAYCTNTQGVLGVDVTGGTFTNPTYQWSVSNARAALSSTTSPTPDIDYITSGTTIIYVTVTDGGACGQFTASKTITISATPDPLITISTTEVCQGNTITNITGSPAGSTRQWTVNNLSPGNPFGTFSAPTNQTTNFTANFAGNAQIFYEVTTSAGCTGVSPAQPITIYAPVAATAAVQSGNQPNVCADGTLTLAASATGGNGSYTYEWEYMGGTQVVPTFVNASILLNNVNAQNPVLTPVNTASDGDTYIFRVKATDGITCNAYSSNLTITVRKITSAALSITGASTICEGGTTTFKVDVTRGNTGGSPTYTLVYNDGTSNITVNNYVSGNAITTNAQSADCSLSIVSIKDNRVTVSSCNSPSNGSPSTLTVNNLTAGVVGSDQTICSGVDVAAFTVTTAATGDGTLSYQWQISTDGGTNWSDISGATGATYDEGTLTADAKYRRITTSTLNSVACTATGNVITVTVNNLTAGVVGAHQTICSGDDVAAFTVVTAATGDGTLSYQWQSSTDGGANWSDISGATGATYNEGVLAADAQYRRVTTSTLNSVACTATSNVITVTVNNLTAGAVGSDQTICSGNDVAAFTEATAATGDGTLSYQWQISTDGGTNWSDISGATGTTYNEGTLTADAQYRRVTTSTLNSVACTATSNVITVTVNNLTAGVVGSDQTICSGADVAAFTVTTAATGDGALSYQWQISTDGGANWNDISGATGASYDEGVLTADAQYRRITTSTLNSVACTATSNVITVTVNNLTAGAIAGDQTICSGDDVAAFTEGTAATGDGALSYQWQISTDGGANWNDISGATGTTYNEGMLSADAQYRRVTTSTLNSVACTATSNVITVMVNNLTAGLVGAGQTICSGDDVAAFTEVNAATGDGTLSYQWQISTNGGANWSDISGATGTTYDEGTLTADAQYRRVTTSTLNSVACTAASNVITVAVNNLTAGVVGSDQTICSGADVAAFTVTTAATGDGALSYQWQASIDGGTTWTDILGATGDIYDEGALTADAQYRRITTSTLNSVACTATGNVITVTVNNLTAGAIAGDQTICSGDDVAAFTQGTAATGDGSLSYQWQISTDGGTNWSDISGATGTTYDEGTLTADAQYRRVTTSTLNSVACTASSNVITITVNNITSGVIAGDQTICSGQTASFTQTTAAVPDGAITYQWQSSTDGGVTWIAAVPAGTAATYTTGALTVNTKFRRKDISSLNSVNCFAYTNVLTVTVQTSNSGTWYVNASTGSDTNLGTINCPKRTIGAALTAAAAGDIINVAAGTYTENVLITKTIQLRGANYGNSAATAALRAARVTETILNGAFSIGNVSDVANNVIIDGFKFIGSSVTFTDRTKVAVIRGTNAKIQNNIFDSELAASTGFLVSGQSTFGITIGGGYDQTGLEVKDNYFVRLRSGVFSNPNLSTSTTYANNQFSSRTGINFDHYGTNSYFATVNGNNFAEVIVGVDTVGPVTAINCTALLGASNMQFTNNTITSNYVGIDFKDIRTGATVNVSNNFFKKRPFATGVAQHLWVRVFPGTSGVTFNNNSITEMGSGAAIVNAGTGTIGATCNWYGTLNANTIASKISGNVTYSSWLVDGTDDQPSTVGFQPVAGACTGTPVVVTSTKTADAVCGVGAKISVTFSGGVGPYNIAWTGGGSATGVTSPFLISSLATGTYTATVTDANGSTGSSPALVIASFPVGNVNTGIGYNDIPSAISAASSGDTLKVCSGTFLVPTNTTFNVNKSLTLRGANYQVDPTITPSVRGAESKIVVNHSSGRAMTISASNVSVDGFEFEVQNSRDAINVMPTLVAGGSVSVSNLNFSNNIFRSSTTATSQKNGILFGENNTNANPSATQDTANITNVTINRNQFNFTVFANSSRGIAMTAQFDWLNYSGFSITNNRFQMGTVNGNGITGTAVPNRHMMTNYVISGNTFTGYAGIDLTKSSNPLIENNTFSSLNYRAIAVGSTNGGAIRNNTIDGAGAALSSGGQFYAYGVDLYGGTDFGTPANGSTGNNSGLIVEQNVISNFTHPTEMNPNFRAVNVRFDAGPGLIIQNNTIDSVQNGVLFASTTTKAQTVQQNSITRASTAIRNNSTSVTIGAECNWYGTFNGSIIASKMSGLVDYSPWLINGTDNDLITRGFQPVVGACSATAVEVTLVSQTNITGCFGDATGAIDINVTGGTGPGSYTYDWSNDGPEDPDNDTEDLTGLAAGTYTVTVTDGIGTTGTLSVTLTQPTAVMPSGTPTHVSCFGGNNGSATLMVTGGTGAYTYDWEGTPTGDGMATITGLTAGTYTVTVSDANNCTATTAVTVTEPAAAVSASISAQTNVSCNGGSNGSATVTPAGGTPGYTYSWSTSPAQTGATATGLAAGTYTVTVTDNKGCQTTTSAMITEPSALTSSITAQTNVSCNGGSNGSATVTPAGGTPGYSYSWSTSPAQTGATATGLAAGTYTVTVTDNKGCQTTSSATITEPSALTSSITAQTNVSCNGGSNGSATVTPAGGTPGYTYSWSTSPAQTGATATGLAAGTYTVTVTDNNSCQTAATVTITQPNAVTPIGTPTHVSCFDGNDGSATVMVSGGTGAYTYDWDGTPTGDGMATITGLTAGTYTVTVTDANNCTGTTAVTVTEPATAVSASISAQTNVSCNGGSNGSATVTPAGGTPGYNYSWSTMPAQTGATATGLAAGTYTVTVTDNKGCQTVTSATITEPSALMSSITAQTNVSCNGLSNGSATVTATGGTTPYSYDWTGTPAGDGTATITGLALGTYTVTVTDANGCIATVAAEITQPVTLTLSASQTNVSCNGGSDGTATVTPAGGTTPYAYSWSTSPAQTGATATGLAAGSYTVTVTDDKGCQATTSVTLTQPAVLAIATSPTNATATVTCGITSAVNAEFTTWNTGITYTGGASPVTVTANYKVNADINNGLVQTYDGATPTAPPADGGYTVVTWTATDNCGNTAIVSRTFTVTNCMRVSGTFKHYRTNAGVSGVNVDMVGPGANDGISDGNGAYTVYSTSTGNFVVIPDSIRVCGACTAIVSTADLKNIYNVSVEDVDAIKAHIASGAQFDNIYQRAAANVVLGSSGSQTNNRLTSADATSLSQAINGSLAQQQRLWRRSIPHDEVLTTGAPDPLPRSWGLVPKANAGDQAPAQYGSFTQRRNFLALARATNNRDFVVLQVGDVVNSSPLQGGGSDARYAGLPLIWEVKDAELQEGKVIDAEFRIEQMRDLRGWQFGLQFDPAYLKVDTLTTTNALPLDPEVDFGMYQADKGEIRSLWAEGVTKSLNQGESVFTLRFTALQGGKNLSEVLNLEEGSSTYALTDQRDQVAVMLSFKDQNKAGQTPVLYQNTPNPFNKETSIRFELPEDADIQLSIHDVNGRLIKELNGYYSKGLHEVHFGSGEMGQYTGVMYYTLRSGDFVATRKMVIID